MWGRDSAGARSLWEQVHHCLAARDACASVDEAPHPLLLCLWSGVVCNKSFLWELRLVGFFFKKKFRHQTIELSDLELDFGHGIWRSRSWWCVWGWLCWVIQPGRLSGAAREASDALNIEGNRKVCAISALRACRYLDCCIVRSVHKLLSRAPEFSSHCWLGARGQHPCGKPWSGLKVSGRAACT